MEEEEEEEEEDERGDLPILVEEAAAPLDADKAEVISSSSSDCPASNRSLETEGLAERGVKRWASAKGVDIEVSERLGLGVAGAGVVGWTGAVAKKLFEGLEAAAEEEMPPWVVALFG